MTKRHPRKGSRTTPRGTRPLSASRPGSPGWPREELPPFVAEAREALRQDSPFGLLTLASMMIELSTPRPMDRFERDAEPRPDGPSLFVSFADSGWPELEALALAVAAMHPDELLARRLRAMVDERGSVRGPRWLATMARVELDTTFAQTEPFGDGENLVVSGRWPDGNPVTLVAYVDHTAGAALTDAFVIPSDAEPVLAADTVDESITTVPLAPADARARITEAIAHGERMLPPVDTETWPTLRPMVEWLIGHLPPGGTLAVRPETSDAERERLLDEFASSGHGQLGGLSRSTVRDLADLLVVFACDYGTGDPLRWSPASVGIVLADWYPRKVFGFPQRELRRLPDVLAAFVRFAHERSGLPAELTELTLGALEELRGDYLALIGRPGRSPFDGATRMARLVAGLDATPDPLDPLGRGADGPDALDVVFDDDLDDDPFALFDDGLDGDEYTARLAAFLEANLIELVGGREAYDALDDVPLADIAIDWSTIPEPQRAPTIAAAALLDEWAGELFDDEVRTIARHVLAAVVTADPAVFSRSSRHDALAAAILWHLHGRLTSGTRAFRLAMPWGDLRQKDLAARTGVSASQISTRSRTVANTIARADIDWTKLLHSAQRRDVLRSRDDIRAWRDASS